MSIVRSPVSNIMRSPIGVKGSTPWQLTDIISAANDWDADLGLNLSGSVINSWTDQIGGEVLSMSGNNRPNLENDGQNIIDMTPDGFGKILTLDGLLTNNPPLAALNQLTGYIAMVFMTTSTSTGGLIGFTTDANVLPAWTSGPMYVPDNVDAIKNLGTTPIVLSEWSILTINARADGYIIRLNGADIYNTTAKNYNFDKFCLNRRISTGSVGYNKFKRIFAADDGLSDADNLYVEGYLASKYGI